MDYFYNNRLVIEGLFTSVLGVLCKSLLSFFPLSLKVIQRLEKLEMGCSFLERYEFYLRLICIERRCLSRALKSVTFARPFSEEVRSKA